MMGVHRVANDYHDENLHDQEGVLKDDHAQGAPRNWTQSSLDPKPATGLDRPAPRNKSFRI